MDAQAFGRSSTITVGVLDFIQLMAWNVPTTRHPSAAWRLRSLSSWPTLNGPLSTLYSIFLSFTGIELAGYQMYCLFCKNRRQSQPGRTGSQ
jgi:hypothetical protein